MTDDGFRRVARNTAILLIGDVGSKLASLGLYVVMARALGLSAFGAFTFAISVVLFLEIAAFGVDQIVTREVARDRSQVARVFWNSIAIKLVGGSIGALGAVVFAVLGHHGGVTALLIGVMALAKVVELVTQTIQSTFRGIEDMTPVAVGMILQRTVTAVGGSVAILVADLGVVSVGVVYFGGALIALAYAAAMLRRRGIAPPVSLAPRQAWGLLAVSWTLGIAIAFTAALARVDIVLLASFTNTSTVGLYGAAYRLFEGTLFLSWTLGAATYPVLSRLRRDTVPTIGEAYALACKANLVILLPVGAAFGLYGELIVRAVYGSDFAPAGMATRLLGVAVALYGLFALAAYTLAASDRQREILIVAAIVLVENVVLNLLLIPRYSLDGAAAAMAASQSTLTLLLMWQTRKSVGTISPGRLGLSPILACMVMAGIWAAAGETSVSFVAAFAGAAITALVAEYLLYPADAVRFWGIVRRRRSGSVSAALSESIETEVIK